MTLILPLFALVAVLSAQNTLRTYNYDVYMKTHRLSWITCYLNTINQPSFQIKTTSKDASGKILSTVSLSAKYGEAGLSAKWNNGIDSSTTSYSGFAAEAPENENEDPAVHIVFYANSTHLGVGSHEPFGLELNVNFKVEDIKRMSVEAYGKNLLYCEESLYCRPPPRSSA